MLNHAASSEEKDYLRIVTYTNKKGPISKMAFQL